MGLFRKMRSRSRKDWCTFCNVEMTLVKKQLYSMPCIRVGHYAPVEHIEFLKKQIVKVDRKAEIPTGTYACGMIQYRCPQCGHGIVELVLFLPVRDKEMVEQILYFENGELDGFL